MEVVCLSFGKFTTNAPHFGQRIAARVRCLMHALPACVSTSTPLPFCCSALLLIVS